MAPHLPYGHPLPKGRWDSINPSSNPINNPSQAEKVTCSLAPLRGKGWGKGSGGYVL